jgi:type II secretory pathway pseudopilin PulG
MQSRVKSFTLAEMLVVMIITVIVIGLAFSVLNLVQKQIRYIEKNFSRATELSLLEQRLWQDFNEYPSIRYATDKLVFTSDIDTVTYTFTPQYSLRSNDTIRAKISVANVYYEGREVRSGAIDAISISGEQELPDYFIFVSAKMDAAHYMNNNGF